MGLFPPGLGKYSAPQGPTGCAPGASLLVNTAYYGGEKTNSGLTQVPPKTARCIQTQQSRRQQHYTGACPSVDLLVIIIESFYVCYVMAECHEVLWLYDDAMSIPANSARHVAGWLACAVHAPGGAGVRRHAGAHTQGRGRVGGRAGAGGQGSASGD